MNEIFRRLLVLPDQASTVAYEIDVLHYAVIGISLLGAVAVTAAVGVLLLRFRRRPGYTPPAHARHAPVWAETLAIGGLLALFLVFWVVGFAQFTRLRRPPEDSIEVYVVGKQWMWTFAYPDGTASIDDLYVPVGRPVRLVLTSRDVIHSFFVPAFRIKQDALPGRATIAWFEVTRPGVYQAFCTEYCGTEHSKMRARVIALSDADWARWAEGRPAEGADLASAGARIAVDRGCLRCHTVDGAPHLGPTWAGLYGRTVPLANGQRVRADEAYLTESMMDPERLLHAGYPRKGGGVFERAAKEITLSPEAVALLGLKGKKTKLVSGPDLLRSILQLDVDLMWFGGIGTYVKASAEAHGEVGDKVNDNVRINANLLRAKVIGEGANLAITQRGRTEYLMGGGRANTDAIDNSAGVDCSDHEVNLKILLSPLMATGALPRDKRDALLRELEPEVAAACVQDNYLQSALLSMESVRSRKHGEAFLDLLSYLDKHGLSRAAEHIPPDDELRGWLSGGKGLPRNLLAVLVAHTKNDLYERVLMSRIPDLPLFQPYLASYFPPAAAERFGEQVAKHHLRREIIATVVTNAIINQAGCTLLVGLSKESSAQLDELVVRYFVCDELLGGQKFRRAVHALDYKVNAADQYNALLAFEDIHKSLLRWWSWNEATWKLGPEDVERTKPELATAVSALIAALDEPARLAYEARESDLAIRGFTPEIATALARAPLLHHAFALLSAAKAAKLALGSAAPLFHRAGKELHVNTFQDVLQSQVPGNTWERRFTTSLEREIANVRHRAIVKLAADPNLIERDKDWADRIGDALGTVKQLGQHGLVPLFLILEDYRLHL